MSFFTEVTPVIPRAISSALLDSALELANPDSCTTPLYVSTLMRNAPTTGSCTNAAFTFVAMLAASMYSPVLFCALVLAQPAAAH
jgi:hypothetical protein